MDQELTTLQYFTSMKSHNETGLRMATSASQFTRDTCQYCGHPELYTSTVASMLNKGLSNVQM